MRTIEITVSPTGETKIETRGFQGAACKAATKDLEAALGLVTKDTATAESRQAATNANKLTQGN